MPSIFKNKDQAYPSAVLDSKNGISSDNKLYSNVASRIEVKSFINPQSQVKTLISTIENIRKSGGVASDKEWSSVLSQFMPNRGGQSGGGTGKDNSKSAWDGYMAVAKIAKPFVNTVAMSSGGYDAAITATNVLDGAAVGASIGTAIAPGVGTAIGAALGGLVGLIEGERQKFEAKDGAFKSTVQDRYYQIRGQQQENIQRGANAAALQDQISMQQKIAEGADPNSEEFIGREATDPVTGVKTIEGGTYAGLSGKLDSLMSQADLEVGNAYNEEKLNGEGGIKDQIAFYESGEGKKLIEVRKAAAIEQAKLENAQSAEQIAVWKEQLSGLDTGSLQYDASNPLKATSLDAQMTSSAMDDF